MRVVAGEHRSRKLKAPNGTNTRPTTDKVKGAIFNIIGPYFNGGTCLDLYAGSGGLGIEALSRGMQTAYFVDNNYQAITTIRDNVESLKLINKAHIIKKDAKQALQELAMHRQKFNLVLLDPPYAKQEMTNILEQLQNDNLLQKLAIVVCEVDKDIEFIAPENYSTIKIATYGITKIIIYRYEG